MIEKIKGSLSVKIFLLTSIILIFISAVTYLFISITVPAAYSYRLDNEISKKADRLVSNLKHSEKEKGEELVKNFSMETGAGAFIQYPNEGIAIHPGDKKEDGSFSINERYIDNNAVEPDIIPGKVSVKQYLFHYADDQNVYTLKISGKTQTVNQINESMMLILPWLAVLILLVSAIVAYFYSRYIARPILEISRISQKISRVELDWQCNENRTDEIGILAGNLNELSKKLSSAISELKRANQKLKTEIEIERNLETQRMEFFSAVSHELKTPVTVLKGQLEGMLCGIGSYKDRDKYLARSLKVTEDMEHMVYEILDIARVDSPQIKSNFEKFDFSEVIRRNLTNHIEIIENKHIQYHIDLEEHIWLYSDYKMMFKVIGNLVSNAVKYSPEKAEILICAGSDSDKVYFSIENTGVHIEEKNLPHVFDAFYRIDSSRNRKTGGTGLGLYLVSRILQRCGAEYCIENTLYGVKFSFSMENGIQK